MSDTVYPIKVTFKGKSWQFTGEDSTGLKNCSQLVSNEVDTRIESDASNMDDIEVPIPEGDYTEDQVGDVLDYYQKNSWAPALYGAVVSNNVNDVVQDTVGQALCGKYGVEQMNGVYQIASFMEMKNLQKLALIRLAVEVFCDSNDLNAIAKVSEKLKIDGQFDMEKQSEMIKKFGFLGDVNA